MVGRYVALSHHRDGTDLHYGRDDLADQSRLVRTLSRDRAKDMATDYEPAQAYAERRGITFREACRRHRANGKRRSARPVAASNAFPIW